MKQNIYLFAIALTVLYIIIAIFQSIIYFQLGSQIYALETFNAWHVCSFVTFFCWTLILLNYFRYKDYTFTFWVAVITALAAIFQFVVVYSSLSGVRQMMNYHIPASLLFISTNILLSLSLIFSYAGKRPWLRAGGIYTLILGTIVLSAIIWSITPPAAAHKAMISLKIHQWISLIGSLAPALLAMNFWEELQLLKNREMGSPVSTIPAFDTLLIGSGMVVLIATVMLGSKIASETQLKLAWETHMTAKAMEWKKMFTTRKHTNLNGDTLSYQLLMPLDYDSMKRYPIVVCLPYGGGVEGCPPAQLLLSEINRKKHPSFLFVPYSPEGTGWGGIPNYPTIDTLVFETVDALRSEFTSIDEKRFYVTGVSKGGYGSWHFICTKPDMFAAAIPVCGEGNPNHAPKIANVAVWAFHGEKDRNVPVEGSRSMIMAIKKAGGDPKYTEFPKEGHDIWNGVTSTPTLLDWLFEQKRN